VKRILDALIDEMALLITAAILISLFGLIAWGCYLEAKYPKSRRCHCCCIHGCDHAPAEKMPNEKKAK
jgi:hypothetical protein